MPCIVSCVENKCNQLREIIAGTSFAPFVSIGFSGEGQHITVGNKSSAPDHHAVIKSFEYGVSEGQGVKVEIFDEDGGNFAKFTERLSKTLALGESDYKMIVDFGWIIKNCDGGTEIRSVKQHGGRLTFLPLKMDVSYEQGKIKFVISATDMMDRISENRIEKNQGSDDQRKSLKQAIRDVFAENDPPVRSVRFLNEDGTPWDFSNADGGPDGPMNTWPGDQQNVLSTVRKWISSVSTDQGRGMSIEWNAGTKDSRPEVILWSGPIPGEAPPDCPKFGHLGTYIVNGGKCSPVISFSPTVAWELSANAGSGGGGTDSTSPTSVKQTGAKNSKIEKVGSSSSFSTDSGQINWRPNPLIGPKNQDANAAHELAVRLREVRSSIEAELKIQGNPEAEFTMPMLARTKRLALVVINPFHLKKSGLCGTWMAEPPCNRVFSNKEWWVQQISHQIQEGNYVTTLKLFLKAPNSDIEPDQPLGGSGGMTFENAQP